MSDPRQPDENGPGTQGDPSDSFVDLGGDSGFGVVLPDPDPFVDPTDDFVASRPAPPPPPPPMTEEFDRGLTPAPSASRTLVDAPVTGDGAVMRDRIVILGRRASGKTVYLARLYHRLFQGMQGWSMEARDGPSHMRCISAMEELMRGQWPAATSETSSLDLDLGFPGGTERLVALDYPGEVFRRAFLEELSGPEVSALIDHVDRAAAVILLIDPGSVIGVHASPSPEDDFGMIQALRRIRRAPRGADVPVALVLTKVDAFAAPIRAAGGVKGFVERHYPALVRSATGARVFGCAAARMVVDPMGRRLPQVRGEPEGVVEPLIWCLTRMGRLRRGEAMDQHRREHERAVVVAERNAEVELRSERRQLLLIWMLAAVLLGIGAIVIWFIVGAEAPR